jgi:hypothetical protein
MPTKKAKLKIFINQLLTFAIGFVAIVTGKEPTFAAQQIFCA